MVLIMIYLNSSQVAMSEHRAAIIAENYKLQGAAFYLARIAKKYLNLCSGSTSTKKFDYMCLRVC